MKLSDAIRLGSKLAEQGFANLKFGGKTCAIGAALDGIEYDFGGRDCDYHEDNIRGYLFAIEQFPELGNLVWLPEDYCRYLLTGKRVSLYDAILDLNDHHKWTREQVADWIDSLTEKKEAELQMSNAAE
jgi:hypothetical protein